MIIERHAFRPADLVAGHVALDFVNTVTGRNGTPRDWLGSYVVLLDWAQLRPEFDRTQLDALKSHPAHATAGALSRATRLREALCRTIYDLIEGRVPDPEDQAEMERAYRAAIKAAHFEWAAAGCRLYWTSEQSGPDLVSHVVAAHALPLLSDPDIERLRVCAGDNCGWVFMDTSRNGRRRWCDMATCGNVAKSRRHYHRVRTS